jgi:hypothetical protein
MRRRPASGGPRLPFPLLSTLYPSTILPSQSSQCHYDIVNKSNDEVFTWSQHLFGSRLADSGSPATHGLGLSAPARASQPLSALLSCDAISGGGTYCGAGHG